MSWKIWSASPPPMLETIVAAECDHRGIEPDSPEGKALRSVVAKILLNRDMTARDLESLTLKVGWFRKPVSPVAVTVH